jgi:phosphatidylserine/phosphatidylglycerophosphate/cardiolipin synthase-like enzyme
MESHIGVGVGKFIETEFESAKNYIWISSPTISQNIGKKLFDLAKKGIKTRVLTSDKITNESDLTNQLAKKLILTNKNNNNLFSLDYKIVSPKEIPMIHAKIYIIDGKCAIIGSANLTENHFWNYAEYILVLREPDFIQTIKEDFEKLWNSCHYAEIDMPGTKKNFKDKVRKIRRGLTK